MREGKEVLPGKNQPRTGRNTDCLGRRYAHRARPPGNLVVPFPPGRADSFGGTNESGR